MLLNYLFYKRTTDLTIVSSYGKADLNELLVLSNTGIAFTLDKIKSIAEGNISNFTFQNLSSKIGSNQAPS